MPRKYMSPRPKGEDLASVFKSITEDTSCFAQQTIKPSSQGGLAIRTVVYRLAEGVRLGIAQDDRTWKPGGVELDTMLMGALHRVYWLAYDLAHQR